MVTKSKKRSKRRASVDPIAQARRDFERGNFKQALKDARACYRKQATPDLRSLLEHVYIARAEQLSRQGLRDDSRRIVQELLDLGVTESSVKASLPELLLSIGLFDRLPADHVVPADERARLQVKIADQAVLRPDDTPRDMVVVRAEAKRIRLALDAVEQGNDAAAMGHLRDIPRQSLFSDWKFFVRGLIEYYRQDNSRMLANWDRLDKTRAAAEIAEPLKVMAGVATADENGHLITKLSRIESQGTTSTALGALMQLQRSATDHDWDQILRTLRTTGGEMRRLDATIYRRVVSWLSCVFIQGEQVDKLDQLARFAEPPPIDPHWHRARAAVRESSGVFETKPLWRKYLIDLESVTVLSPTEQDLAKGMIHLHLADDFSVDAHDLRRCGCPVDHSLDVEYADAEALKHFNKCLALAPSYRPIYTALYDFHIKADRQHKAVEVLQRWLGQDPDDLDALLNLGEYYLDHGAPLKAQEFISRAHQLKPLDKTVANLLWCSHVALASRHARQNRFDQARDELTTADRLQPSRADDYETLARKAVLEIKAGDPKAARSLIEQAQDAIPEPTALWLVMAIEAIHVDLPPKEAWLYEKRWHDALKRRCRSDTAAQLCRALAPHLPTSRKYKGHQTHVQTLLKYLRRCSRVKWQEEDLRSVCAFVDAVDEYDTLAKLVKRGLRRFPQAAYLHLLAAKAEVAKGPLQFNRLSTSHNLEEAIRLGASSNDPRDKDVVDMAKETQSILEEFSRGDYEHHYNKYDDDEEEEEEERFGHVLDIMLKLPPEMLAEVITGSCREMGIDPKKVMKEIERRRAAQSREKR